jgi:hypothetical protein
MEDLGEKTGDTSQKMEDYFHGNGRVVRPFLKMEGPGISQRSNSTLECAVQIHYLEFALSLSLSLSLSLIHTHPPMELLVKTNGFFGVKFGEEKKDPDLPDFL